MTVIETERERSIENAQGKVGNLGAENKGTRRKEESQKEEKGKVSR